MDRYRATTSTGSVVDQPSAVQLAELVAEVDRVGCDAFLVVERTTGDAETRLLASRARDGWAVDLHDGRPETFYKSQVDDAALVFSAVAYWVLRARPWPGLAWRRNSAQGEGLARAV